MQQKLEFSAPDFEHKKNNQTMSEYKVARNDWNGAGLARKNIVITLSIVYLSEE